MFSKYRFWVFCSARYGTWGFTYASEQSITGFLSEGLPGVHKIGQQDPGICTFLPPKS